MDRIIRLNVELVNTIFTDFWSGYNNLNPLGYYYFTVNHTLNFVDPISGVNTQKIVAIL